MTVNNNTHKLALFPLCDHHGALREALRSTAESHESGEQTRSDAVFLAWMLSVPSGVDAVGAAKAILLVARTQLGDSATSYQRELMDSLVDYVENGGRLPMSKRLPGILRNRNYKRRRETVSLNRERRE